MGFDSNKPAANSALSSADMRNTFGTLKTRLPKNTTGMIQTPMSAATACGNYQLNKLGGWIL